MDPSDKKRAHSANSDSAANLPAKRHQPMTHQATMSSAQAADGRQSAAVSGHPTAMEATPAASSTEPTVAASSMPAGVVAPASAAISRRSPGQRCPVDPLSVAFSFLDTRDFASASRVCRHWHCAAELQSAWPEFSVDRLISGLVENEYEWADWSDPRSVRLYGDHLKAGAMQRLAQSPKWRRVVELHLNGYIRDQEDESVPPIGVAQQPHPQSVQVNWIADVSAAFSSMAPRLQVLEWEELKDTAIHPHLHLLANLRVLALSRMDKIDGQALLPLHELEYLRLHCHLDRDLLLAIRRLSVQHRLRHLSLTSNNWQPLDVVPLMAGLDESDSGLAPAALVSMRLHCNLSAASCSALLSLPSLTRLEWSGAAADDAMPTGQHVQASLPSSPLQRLHLDFGCEAGIGGAARLLQQAAIRAPQLRELCICFVPGIFQEQISIPPLRSLHLLDISLSRSSWLDPELLQSLAALPLFSELIVRLDEYWPRPFVLTEDMLRVISESRSWRLIRLFDCWYEEPIRLPDGVDAQLAGRLGDLRVRVEFEGTGLMSEEEQAEEGPGASVYRLVVDSAQGTVIWLQMAMLATAAAARLSIPAEPLRPWRPPHRAQQSSSLCPADSSAQTCRKSGRRTHSSSSHVHRRIAHLLRTAGGLAKQMPVDAADEATARRLRVESHTNAKQLL